MKNKSIINFAKELKSNLKVGTYYLSTIPEVCDALSCDDDQSPLNDQVLSINMELTEPAIDGMNIIGIYLFKNGLVEISIPTIESEVVKPEVIKEAKKIGGFKGTRKQVLNKLIKLNNLIVYQS